MQGPQHVFGIWAQIHLWKVCQRGLRQLQLLKVQLSSLEELSECFSQAVFKLMCNSDESVQQVLNNGDTEECDHLSIDEGDGLKYVVGFFLDCPDIGERSFYSCIFDSVSLPFVSKEGLVIYSESQLKVIHEMELFSLQFHDEAMINLMSNVMKNLGNAVNSNFLGISEILCQIFCQTLILDLNLKVLL